MIKNSIPQAKTEDFYIGNMQNINPADLNNNGIDDLKEGNFKKAFDQPVPELPLSDLPDIPKKKFKNTKVGRILITTAKGKNVLGKILYSALGIGGAAEASGALNLIPTITTGTMNIELLDVGIWLFIAAITFITSRNLVKGILNDLATEVLQAAETLRKARQADSPKGEDISETEKAMLLKEVDDILTLVWRRMLRNKIANLFGLNISQEHEKKI